MKRINYQFGELLGNCYYLYDVGIDKCGAREAMFLCGQDGCNKEFVAKIKNVKSFNTTSCGCFQRMCISSKRTTHGMSKTLIYGRWANIKMRCFNDKDISYKNYGGRGITIYNPWVNSFKLFYDYVSKLDGYGVEGLTIDRINNNEGYYPGNLRWATPHVQNVNQEIRSNNKTGYIGVYCIENEAKYISYIGLHGDLIRLGTHNSIKEALAARNEYIIDNNLTEYKIQKYHE